MFHKECLINNIMSTSNLIVKWISMLTQAGGRGENRKGGLHFDSLPTSILQI
jgi:hypothetical protein